MWTQSHVSDPNPSKTVLSTFQLVLLVSGRVSGSARFQIDLIDCPPSLLYVPSKLLAGMITKERPEENIVFIGEERLSGRNMAR